MTPQECAAMGEMMSGMMGQMMGGWGTGLPWVGLLLVAVVVIGVVLAVVLARRSAPSGYDDPREILRRRFARGEVSIEDFAAALKTLG